MKIILLTPLIVLFFQLQMFGQDMEQRVTVKVAEMPLELLLNKLSDQYKVRFSYGHHQKLLERKITIQVDNQSLSHFLTLILGRAGLTYKVVGGYVVLRKEQKHTIERAGIEGLSSSQGGESVSPMKENSQRLSHGLGVGRKLDIPVQVQKRGPVEIVLADGPILLVLMPVRLYSLPAPERNTSAVMLGPVFSLDLLYLHVESAYEANQELHPEVNFSIGGAGLWELSDRMVAEMQVLLRKKDFTVQYLISTEGQSLGIPEKTKVSLASLEVPLALRFLLLKHRRFAFYGSPGLFGSVLLKKEEKTWLDDGRFFPSANMHLPLISDFLWGGRGALNIRFALSRKFFLSVVPAYQYSFNPLRKGTQQIRQGELTVRAGLLIRL